MAGCKISLTLTDEQKEKLVKQAARTGMTIQELLQAFVYDLVECNNHNYDEWMLLDNWKCRKAKANIIRYSAEELGKMDYFYKRLQRIEEIKKEMKQIKEEGRYQEDLPYQMVELQSEQKGLKEDFQRFVTWAKNANPCSRIEDFDEELLKLEEWFNELDIFENN